MFQQKMIKDPLNSNEDKPVWDEVQSRSIFARARMEDDDDKPVWDVVENQTPISVETRFLIDAPPLCSPGQRKTRKGCRTISINK